MINYNLYILIVHTCDPIWENHTCGRTNAYLQTLAIWPFYTGSKLNLVSKRSIIWSFWVPNSTGYLCKMPE